ncbi:hypothetical protein B9Z55_009108 [Caenorhabditis nigoni]|uniref:RING-type domain-containing protein n=1 Tax=Caenorhabditis nigoni TaxID=1611254 RepID=A0A2G5UQN9_9PELO|nr:hypothetical protein B9Z55_009108 [Caenorhabditis nigoni]
MTKKFKESRLLDYCKNDVIYKHSDDREGNWSMFFSDHTLLQFNFLSSNLKEQEKDGEEAKLFFVTVDDIERAEREFNMKEDNKLLLSLTHFVEKYPEKRIYLREVRSIRNSEFRRFFSGEVLEMISILLKRQNGRINNEKLIEKYQEKWKSGNCGMHTTIDLEELEIVLEEFDIDKSSITIVPDPKFQWQKSRVGENGIDSDFGIIGPNRYRVIDSSDAIFNTFLAAVCDVNWATGHCGSHENCGNISKESIIETINRILIIPESTLIIDLFIISHLKSLVCLHGKSDESEYDKFMHQTVTLESYVKTAKHYNLQVFLPDRLDIENSEDQSLEWILRVYLLTGWACQFFDGENLKLKRVVLHNLSYRIPERYKNRIQPFLQKMLDDDAELISSFERRQKLLKSAEKRNEKLRKRKEDAKKAEKKIDLFRDLDKIEMVPVSKEEIKEIAADAEERRHAMAEYFHSTMSARTEVEEDIARHRFLDTLGLSVPSDPETVQEENKLEVKATHSQKKGKVRKSIVDQNSGDLSITEEECKDVNQNIEPEIVPLPEPALTEPTNQQKIEKKESKCCSKCLRTSEMCNEAKKELKSTQNRLEKYEKKAKRTEDVEKELKALKLEMKRMKTFEKKAERLDDVEKKLKEKNQEVKTMGKKLKQIEEQWTEIERKNSEIESAILEMSRKVATFNEENCQLRTEIANFGAEKEALEEQIELERARVLSLESEILEQKIRDESLETEVRRQRILNEEQQKMIQSLTDRLASSSSTSSATPTSPSVPNKEACLIKSISDIQNSLNRLEIASKNDSANIKNLLNRSSISADIEDPHQFRITLQRLRNIKDRFQNKDQLKLARTMTDKLITMSNRSEIRELALYEYQQYEANFQNYTQLVDLNIEKMKETRDCSLYSPLPKPPAFSDRFMNEYWLECDKKKKELEMDISDSECLICFFEMNSDQKTLKCDHCNKITHLKCASKWLQIHRSCPHCRREQLDPEEFPALS